ncbi:hypothetical protein AB3H13_27450 [Escherichia coli]
MCGTAAAWPASLRMLSDRYCGQAAGRRSGFSGQRQGRHRRWQPGQGTANIPASDSGHATEAHVNQGGGIAFQGSKTWP